MKYISYLRVSTQNQSESNLGIQAQKSMIKSFIKDDDTIIEEFIEVESGKNNNRPKLNDAIALTKSNNAVLLIAKLDRLSRNAAFIFKLRDSEVEFRAVDMPDANTLTIGIMAILAQHEREEISKRTKQALQIKRLRGDKMGTPENLTKDAIQKGFKSRQYNAQNHPANVQAKELIVVYRQINLTFNQIAQKLNDMGMRTRYNKLFIASTVQRMYKSKMQQIETNSYRSPSSTIE